MFFMLRIFIWSPYFHVWQEVKSRQCDQCFTFTIHVKLIFSLFKILFTFRKQLLWDQHVFHQFRSWLNGLATHNKQIVVVCCCVVYLLSQIHVLLPIELFSLAFICHLRFWCSFAHYENEPHAVLHVHLVLCH